MNPVDFEQANFTFTRPPSMTAEECGDLRVYRGDEGENISCWELSDEDIEQLKKTRKIWLWIWAQRHPPVALDLQDPWEKSEPEVTHDGE